MTLNRNKTREFINSLVTFESEQLDEERDITIFKNCKMKQTFSHWAKDEEVGDVHVQWKNGTFSFIRFMPINDVSLMFGVNVMEN